MISPHTAPGTKVVLLRTPKGMLVPERGQQYKAGDIFTISQITDSWFWGIVAEVEEDGGETYWCLSLFRYLELPKSITDCLTERPLLVEETV